MVPAGLCDPRCAAATRRRRAGRRRAARGGFTLVEMMISVTLVLLMMLMFAEIYSLAQQTISTQRGIAENDQKARILAEVLRRDLATRTFRSVYPFKLEASDSFATVSDTTQELIARRQGYFAISENHPDVDIDDNLSLTIAADQVRYGRPGDRLYGKATSYPSPSSPPVPVEEQPEFDDGILGNFSGGAAAAEVSYFLRNGNLYRSQLLIRKPYSTPSTGVDATPIDFPQPYPAPFAQDFDYAAYRDYDVGGGAYETRFHGPGSLDNNTDGASHSPFLPPAAENLYFPRFLSVPHLRHGHLAFDSGGPAHAPPLEFLGPPIGPANRTGNFDSVTAATPRPDYFGRFTTFEQTNAAFAYPSSGAAPFDNATTLDDTNGDGVVDLYESGGSRRGVDLMLANVHSFDIEVWDDIIGGYVDLGHSGIGTNPYTGGVDEPGFYSAARLRRPLYAPNPTLTPAENFRYDHSSITTDYGNRFDTWSPRMMISDDPTLDPLTAAIYRTGRAPYRPQKTNPDPNTAAYNEPGSTLPGNEAAMVFGNTNIDTDLQPPGGDTFSLRDGDAQESDGEVPLRAIRITIRYLDVASGQTRQTTLEQSLID